MHPSAQPFSVKIRRLLILFGLLGFVVVFSLSGFYEGLKLKRELAAAMRGAAVEVASLLQDSVMQHRRYIEEIITAMPEANDAAVRQYLLENLPLLGPEDSYFVLNGDRRVIHASRKAADFVGLDFSHLPAVQAEAMISGVHQSLATLRPVVTIRYQLPANRLMLVERDLFNVAPLIAHVRLAGTMPQGLLFVLTDNGTVVYHPDEQLVKNRHPLGFELRDWQEADAQGLQQFTYLGIRYLAYRQALTVPEGWIFYAALPYQRFVTTVVGHLAFQAMAIAVLFAALIVLLHFLINRKVSRPISCLAEHLAGLNPLKVDGGCEVAAAAETTELAQILSACERMAANIRAANERLVENEQLFRTVTEFATDWSYWLDPEGNFVYVSPVCETLTGYSAEEFSANPGLMAEIIHPEEREQGRVHIHQAVHNLSHTPQEFRIVAKDGTVRWLSHVCRPIRDAAGRFLGVRGSNTDISERKQAELILQESEERFRALVEQAMDGLFLHDLEGRIVEVNPSGCRMLGMARHEVVGKNIADFETAVDLATMKKFWNSLQLGEAHTVHGRARSKQGPIFPVEIQLGLVKWAGQRLVMAITRDISERQKAADALAAEKELLTVTLRSIGDGVITTDAHGRVLILSRVAEKLTGWSQEEAKGLSLDEILCLVDHQTKERRESPVAQVLARGQIVALQEDTLLIARDGTERLIADSGAPIFDRQSRIIGVVVVFRDITEQHRLEQEAYKAHKLESLGVLAGGIAHDFNNLLTSILGNISITRLDVTEPALERQLLAAEKAAMRAQGLTQQLLTFAKGGAPIKAVASMAELIKESAEFSLHGAKVRHVLSCPAEPWPVEVDAGQMTQVMNNLLLNAAQAMPTGGVIEVTLRNVTLGGDSGLPLPPGSYVQIAIADHGLGIAPEDQERIFDPYFSTKESGAGLGLASSYSIIKRHGGHIAVASHAGQGATFTIHLPAAPDKAVVVPSCPVDEGPVGGQGRVLVMDDEQMVCELAKAVLERLGYEVDFADEGNRALALYEEAMATGRPYDVVIMDLTIPGGMGGQEAIKELLRLDPQARAIVSSGYAQDPVMANYRDYGFAAVLAKPYSLEALGKALQSLLQENDPASR